MLFGGVVPRATTRDFPADDARDRVRLRGVAEEERAGLGAELEPVRHVRTRIPVRVDREVVARVGRERVPVGPGRGIFTGYDVGEDRDGVRLVRAAKRVQVREVGRRVLRDERCLAVRRRRAGPRPERGCADRRGCCEQAAGDERCDPSVHLHSLLDFRSGTALVRGNRRGGSEVNRIATSDEVGPWRPTRPPC